MSDRYTQLVGTEKRPRWHRFLRAMRPLNLLYCVVNGGEDYCHVPNDWKRLEVFHPHDKSMEYGFVFTNDAHEIDIYCVEHGHSGQEYSHRYAILNAQVMRRFAIWYLCCWAWGEWFGLRRWLFYRWLNMSIAQQRKIGGPEPKESEHVS